MSLVTNVRDLLRFKYWAKMKLNFFPSYYSSHSQFGEDMLLRSLFGNKKDGLYVDIGAHHPVYFSNTFHFYLKGWSGVNIDAAPGSMKAFSLLRSRDKNIEVCLGPNPNETVNFYIFDKPALNTFDPHMAEEARKHSSLLKTCQLKTKTLNECLAENIEPGRKIDFLSIDVEGLDETILKTNDWSKYSPRVIVFESHNMTMDNFKDHSLVRFLNEKGYQIIGKMGPSFVAKLNEFSEGQ